MKGKVVLNSTVKKAATAEEKRGHFCDKRKLPGDPGGGRGDQEDKTVSPPSPDAEQKILSTEGGKNTEGGMARSARLRKGATMDFSWSKNVLAEGASTAFQPRHIPAQRFDLKDGYHVVGIDSHFREFMQFEIDKLGLEVDLKEGQFRVTETDCEAEGVNLKLSRQAWGDLEWWQPLMAMSRWNGCKV
ncbi:hypothetical protein CYMTET_24623 [Cymbomonas tetramitiformis]|uniref:Uncharacterized protein n=1 Tax=Cymbomonas tetramitiformis TaxID=36881 RepID=A0AAE0KZQ9_9CHLO|nr:hypothetical protein CYMTET_24623 [Cymbomonas tetramitiformis]